ncbi:inverse autotransporter beta domain-containing protein, partial [Enterobacter asburiae]
MLSTRDYHSMTTELFFSFRNTRNVALLCLLLQFFSLVSVTFSPVLAARDREVNALYQTSPEPYVLRSGESPETVARQFGLTLQQLKTYNQFRVFHKPFVQLSEGDELDVPSHNRLKVSPFSVDNEKQVPVVPGQPDGALPKESWPLPPDRVLNDSHNGGAAAGMARSMASGAANDAVSKWLSQYGTVRAGLSLDENSSLTGSNIDWLIPLYDTPQNTLFTQLGARNRDGRNTVNLGWGVRWMTPHWMYGFNNFYDDDITGNNRRVGLGAEARTDYLQFAANTYIRTSNWHQSRDFDDYDERPANGFDVRAQGWLPSYPQLGGKLTYEQYYGDEVALFGKDNRQRNPYAVTAGLNWTPFPLLTVGIDERMGKSGQNETNFSLQLTWHPGESLSSQLTASSVAASRLVANSRYDLVDRNNDIVLEYRKQDVISLTLDQTRITGPAGASLPLSAQVRNKYELQTVIWSAEALEAAGGRLKAQDRTHFIVTLPPYQTVQRAQAAKNTGATGQSTDPNSYVITAVAEDIRGNKSSPQNVTITVLPPTVAFSGPLRVSHDNAVANGKDSVNVAATVADGNGHPLANQQVVFTTVYPDGTHNKQTAVTDGQGNVSVDITSVVSGEATVTATAETASITTHIHFTEGIDAGRSTLNLTPATILADGTSVAVLKLFALNSSGNPVTGKVSRLSFPVTGVTGVKIAGLVEAPEASGHYTAQVSGTQAGVAAISVTYGGTTISGLSASLTLIPANTPSVTTSQLTVDRTSIPADGKTPSTLKLTLRNANGIPVIDAQGVEFISSLTTGVNISPVVNHGDGTYTAELTGTTAGMTAVISARVGGMVLGTISQSVALTDGDADVSQSQFTVDKTIITADGVDKSTLKLTLRNAGGVPVTNQQGVVFRSSRATGVTVSPVTINGDGTYTAVLSGTAAGSAVVTITIDGQAFGVASQVITLTAGEVDTSKSTLKLASSPLPANGSATTTVTLTLRDINDNPVTGSTTKVTFTASPDSSVTFGPVSESPADSGTYITTVTTGTAAGPVLINAQPYGKSVELLLTGGAAEVSASAIMLDNVTYVTGAPMTATVTL